MNPYQASAHQPYTPHKHKMEDLCTMADSRSRLYFCSFLGDGAEENPSLPFVLQ